MADRLPPGLDPDHPVYLAEQAVISSEATLRWSEGNLDAVKAKAAADIALAESYVDNNRRAVLDRKRHLLDAREAAEAIEHAERPFTDAERNHASRLIGGKG